MSRGALQKLQRRSRYEKRNKLVFCTESKKGLEIRSSRFEPKISWISFSRVSGPLLNSNRNPEWWGDFSQLVRIEKIKILVISWYEVELRFWLDLNSEVSCRTNSNWDFGLIWICSWLKSPHYSGFRLPFNSAFRVLPSTERAVVPTPGA